METLTAIFFILFRILHFALSHFRISQCDHGAPTLQYLCCQHGVAPTLQYRCQHGVLGVSAVTTARSTTSCTESVQLKPMVWMYTILPHDRMSQALYLHLPACHALTLLHITFTPAFHTHMSIAQFHRAWAGAWPHRLGRWDVRMGCNSQSTAGELTMRANYTPFWIHCPSISRQEISNFWVHYKITSYNQWISHFICKRYRPPSIP